MSGEKQPTEAKTESPDLSATMIIPAKPKPDEEEVPEDFLFIHVEVLGGPMDGLSSRVPKASFAIGRGTENDLRLPLDRNVSTRHASIVREGRTFWLQDLESRNGTYIGESRLDKRVPIGPGTTFRVGRTKLEFMPR